MTNEKQMRGLEIARGYYDAYGAEMLRERFPDIAAHAACGLCGSGSECFGYDDGVSRDHDFEPGFCIFVPDDGEIDRRRLFELEREYSRLPREFAGLRRTPLKPVGGARHGVMNRDEFFRARIGVADGRLTAREWLALPENSLAEATNGEVFHDGDGEFTAIRRRIAEYPRPVMLKKLAGRLLLAAQSGQYNYARCIGHGESAAAQFALAEFVRHAAHAAFLLRGRYAPYYKWIFRALRDLPDFGAFAETFEFLLTTDNSSDMREIKIAAVEDVCAALARDVEAQNIAPADVELERLAYAVNDAIDDPDLRAMHILAAVE